MVMAENSDLPRLHLRGETHTSLSTSTDPLVILLCSKIQVGDAFEKFQSTALPCHVCHKLVKRAVRDETYRMHLVSLKDVKITSEAGCVGCKLLLYAHERSARAYSDRNQKGPEVIEFPQGNDDLVHFSAMISLWYRTPLISLRSYYGRRSFEIFTVADKKVPEMYIRRRNLRSEICGSVENLNLISKWIENCETHAGCTPQEAPKSMPTRVLDIAGGRIRLRPGSDMTGPYCALSHCWGASQVLQTTRSTLISHEDGISENDLPKTFVEAIAVARHVKARSIWIDSLCIAQDDRDDWIRESARMAAIYQHAFLVISATSAKDGSTGCFMPRDTCDIPEHCFNMPLLDGATAPVYIYEARNLLHPVAPMYSSGTEFPRKLYEEKYPLMMRAWAFQERFLASRIVHFERDEITWECRTCRDCECGALNNEASRWLTWNDEYEEDPNRIHTSSFKKQWAQGHTKGDLFELWRNIVNAYYSKRLTYPSDRLPAFSGLVKAFQDRGCGQCVAGIWVENIILDIMWHVSAPGERYSRPSEWRAPSWSWASASLSEGPIYTVLVPDLRSPKATFVAIDYEVEGADPTGALRRAMLTICAPALEVQMVSCSVENGKLISSGREWDVTEDYRVQTEHGRWIYGVAGSEWKLNLAEDWTLLDSTHLDDPHEDFDRHREYSVLLVWMTSSTEAPLLPEVLILRSSRGLCGRAATPGSYERVGVFGRSSKGDRNVLRKWFEGVEERTITIV